MGLNSLVSALRLENPIRLAVVGAGGKTSALFRLARELPSPVILTTTTHLGADQVLQAEHQFFIEPSDPNKIIQTALLPGVNLFAAGDAGEHRVAGLDINSQQAIYQLAENSGRPLLIEADGARLKPIKAPAAHEPAIPAWAQQVVVVAGLQALGKPLNSEWVHRPEIFSRLSNIAMGDLVSGEALVRVLVHPEGGLKNIPTNSRRMLILNQADTPELIAQAESLVQSLNKFYPSIVIASLKYGALHRVIEPAAGVILAAGGSNRLGQPKQLLNWHGQPFIRKVAQTALQAGLSPVWVVIGAGSEAVQQALSGLPVSFVLNEHWHTGQSSSLRAGIRALEETVGSAVFLLSDQPQVTVDVIQALVKLHRLGQVDVIAPMVGERRANPVLFDRKVFSELLKIEGDVGGRALMSRLTVTELPWEDRRLLMDVDTLEDYQRLLETDSKSNV